MAREVISDSLIKGCAEGALVELKTQVQHNSLKSRPHDLRINTEHHELSMSSWTMRSVVNEQLMTLKQDSEFEQASEIMAQSYDFFLDNQITPKIASGLPASL